MGHIRLGKRRTTYSLFLCITMMCLALFTGHPTGTITAMASSTTDGYTQFEELGAEVQSIRFGLNAPRGASFSSREYFTDSTNRIYYLMYVQFSKQLEETKGFEVQAVFYKPDGSILSTQTAHQFQVKPGSEGIYAYSYIDWEKQDRNGQGNWPSGEYQVDLLVDKREIGSGTFRISPTVNAVGNSSGNLNNKGLVAKQGDWIYFASDEGILHRIKFNGEDKTRLTKNTVQFINVQGAWVYYVNDSKSNIISRTRIDGKGTEEVISHDHASSLTLYHDWLYYINHSDQGKIYKIKLDGTEKTKLSEQAAHHFTIFENNLYYIQDNGKEKEEKSGSIYKLDIQGGKSTQVTEDKVGGIVAVDGWLYYINTSDKQALYRMKTNGSEEEKLVDDQTIAFYADEEWAYYQKELNRGRILFKMNVHSKETTELETKVTRKEGLRYGRTVWEFPKTFINIANDWLYYSIDELLYTNQYRMKTEQRSGGEKVEGITDWDWHR